MVEVRVERDLEFGAQEIWAIIADFGNVSWVPGVEKVELEGEGIGMVRHLTVPVYPQLHERLEAIDHEKMILDYSIPAVAYLHLKDYRARAEVSELGSERCRLVWSGIAEVDGVDDEQAIAETEAFYGSIMDWICDYLVKQRLEKAGDVPLESRK
jgi:hypothetical protein